MRPPETKWPIFELNSRHVTKFHRTANWTCFRVSIFLIFYIFKHTSIYIIYICYLFKITFNHILNISPQVIYLLQFYLFFKFLLYISTNLLFVCYGICRILLIHETGKNFNRVQSLRSEKQNERKEREDRPQQCVW